jgi:hypothetical protein
VANSFSSLNLEEYLVTKKNTCVTLGLNCKGMPVDLRKKYKIKQEDLTAKVWENEPNAH